MEWKEKQDKIEKERFEKAKKISFDEYEGFFLRGDRVINKEDLEDELCSMIYDNENPPNYIFATIPQKIFTGIDLEEVMSDKCEDGYEDMCSYFNYQDEDFLKAQELLNKWLVKHDSILDIYYEDFNTVVLLNDVIEDIKKQNQK